MYQCLASSLRKSCSLYCAAQLFGSRTDGKGDVKEERREPGQTVMSSALRAFLNPLRLIHLGIYPALCPSVWAPVLRASR